MTDKTDTKEIPIKSSEMFSNKPETFPVPEIIIDVDVANDCLAFLTRIQLAPAEIQAYLVVQTALRRIVDKK
ncbi:MAG: hypothetical protein KAS32_11650, partial [Candidatus Peribacteraceae bacterium]|nr:hypothetical protein [Candidatus Peribacteraceae bacterium]